MTETLQVLWQGLWSSNPVPGRIVIVAILAVVGLAIVVARRHVVRYRRELSQIDRLARRLAEWRAEGSGAAQVAQVPEPSTEESMGGGGDEDPALAASEVGEPEYGSETGAFSSEPTPGHPGIVDIQDLIQSVDPRSLVGDRVRAIAKMRHYRVKVDLDTLQELALYRDAATSGHGYPAFAAGLSMMLGILGTFMGLASMVQEIHLGLPSDAANLTFDAWMSSVDQLGAVLGGMKTAFSTSLVGISGAILSSGLAFRLGQLRRQVFEALERLTAEELIPATVPAVEDENLLAEVSRRLDESFTLLEEIHRQNQESLKDLTAAQQACVAIVDQVRDITRGQAARNLDEVLGQLARSNEAVLEVSRQLPSVVSVFESTARSLQESAFRLVRPEPVSKHASGVIFGLRPATWIAILVGLVALLALARSINAL
jgi:hypothetical protein